MPDEEGNEKLVERRLEGAVPLQESIRLRKDGKRKPKLDETENKTAAELVEVREDGD